ncbi:MAG: AAA family ATPase [Nanohaloarchaea archaeon]|nr:AAA family ATPase [Candidatus Nanohaloarchaea archaeon]
MYTEREIKNKFMKVLNIYPIITLVGVRQAGKTTFLKEQMKSQKYSYVLFDDPDARELFEEDIKKFEKQYIEGYELTVLDEVQYCKDAGRKLKYLAEKKRRLWVTSSSETILEKYILSYLVGRVSILRLYPFSLTEFLDSHNQKEQTLTILKRNIWEHMTYGGYPKVVTTTDYETKKIILKDLYDTMILKDVAQTFSIDDIRTLDIFTRYLAINMGCLISYDTLSSEMSLSFQTVKKYLDAMEKSYIISRVTPFCTNKSKEITKQPKLYFIDTGLRNIIAKDFQKEPSGNLFENYIFSELLKLGFSPKYWRTKTKAEVDFIIETDTEIIPIEVKVHRDAGKVDRGLRSFIESYNPKRAYIITYKGKKGTMMVGSCKVTFTDTYKMKQLLSK